MNHEIKIELIEEKSAGSRIQITCKDLCVTAGSLSEAIRRFDDKLEPRLRLGWEEAKKREQLMRQDNSKPVVGRLRHEDGKVVAEVL